MSQTATDTLAKKSRSDEVISGGHLVAKALKNEGVDTIFTLCGGHIIDIYDGCLDEGIRIIDVRHEQTAAHANSGSRLYKCHDRDRNSLPIRKSCFTYRWSKLSYAA